MFLWIPNRRLSHVVVSRSVPLLYQCPKCGALEELLDTNKRGSQSCAERSSAAHVVTSEVRHFVTSETFVSFHSASFPDTLLTETEEDWNCFTDKILAKFCGRQVTFEFVAHFLAGTECYH